MMERSDRMYNVVSEFHAGKYTVLELNQNITEKNYTGFKIDGKKYEAIPVYDLPGHIAIEADGSFVGKDVTCI